MRGSIHVLLIAVVLAACSNEECPAGYFDCGYGCTDILNDPGNCGACSMACQPGQVCTSGTCTLSCQEGYQQCSGVCRDTRTDQYNCGTCSMTCAAGYLCIDGSCSPDCPEGYTSCSGVCKNTTNDPMNCGDCANACASGEVCMAGTCTFMCPSPYIDCSGSCADLDTDHMNCGSCGNACLSGQVCEEGACQNSCITGLTLCSGACVDLMRDRDNCGSCGSRCGSGDNCYDGTCLAACPGGFTDCSGTCRDLDSDRLNCGVCDEPCLDGERCASGTCEVTCEAPLISCPHDSDGDTVMDRTMCSDTTSDPRNCGGCAGSGGVDCPRGEACVAGSCEVLICPAPTYSHYFPAGTLSSSSAQCVDWNSWRSTLDATGCSGIHLSGTFDTTGIMCTNPTYVREIADALRTTSSGSWSCDGRTWYVGSCGGWALSVQMSVCSCTSPAYSVRPCINNPNWGGINTATCSAPAQTMTISFF